MTDPSHEPAEAQWHAQTRAVRGGLTRSQFHETSEALYLTSGYAYPTAADAEAAFAGTIDHMVYSRYTNPTVAMLQDRLRLLEGAEACRATSSGMAAVFLALAALCGQGDRVVASRALFGACYTVVDEILPRWGIERVFVDGPDLDQWRAALQHPTTAVFFETPSNPMQELVDIAVVSELAHAAGAQVVVDNVFGTPVHSRPLDLGADIVVYSATKHIDGQGRVLGGAVLGPEEFVAGPVEKLLRNLGPSMSPFNAWVLLKGLETLELRVNRMADNALTIAEFLERHPRVRQVWYPWLASHPQHGLALRQMSGGGTVITFAVDGGKDRAFAVVDGLELFDISNNLGDAKSLVTHPATTTHQRIGPERRAEMGVGDDIVRLSIGLEDPRDLIADLRNALD